VVGDRERLEAALGDARGLVRGDTDSERLFALITMSVRAHGNDLRAGIVAATRRLAAEFELYSLNFVLTTADELWALRYPEHNELFVLERAAGGPRGGRQLDEASAAGTLRMRSGEASERRVVVVASERMDEDLGWDAVRPGELVRVGPDLQVSREVVLPDPPRHPMRLRGRAASSQAQEG
jgi:glutamine amidotransferase